MDNTNDLQPQPQPQQPVAQPQPMFQPQPTPQVVPPFSQPPASNQTFSTPFQPIATTPLQPAVVPDRQGVPIWLWVVFGLVVLAVVGAVAAVLLIK